MKVLTAETMGKAKKPVPEEEPEEIDDPVEEEDGDEEEEDSEDNAETARKFISGLAPDIRNRVFALLGLQKDYDALHAKYIEEMCELEKRYDALYTPLYERRRDVVQGSVEPTAEEIGATAKITEIVDEDTKVAPADDTGVKGIPNFWLGALKNNEVTEDLIKERDEPCLKHLVDITAKNFDNPNKGFTLNFYFSDNIYFTNTVLTKTYHLDDEDEIMLEKADGCTINWKPEQNLTVILKKKKQKQKGGKNTRVVTKPEPCDSFFNFFSPPQIPEDDDEDKEEDEDDSDDLEERIEMDYEVGRTIKDRIVSNAVDWYTGEAIKPLELPPGMGQGDDELPDDEDEEIEDDKDSMLKKIKNPANPGQPPECKQQ